MFNRKQLKSIENRITHIEERCHKLECPHPLEKRYFHANTSYANSLYGGSRVPNATKGFHILMTKQNTWRQNKY